MQPGYPPPPQYTPPFAVNRPYAQPVMTGVYASPPQHGSLGTPHMPRWNRSPSGSHDGRGSWRGPGSAGGMNNAMNGNVSGPPSGVHDSNITLVPTRPLLKALARECKPSPPWCVGFPAPQSVTEELLMFNSFLRHTPEEQMRWSSLVATIETAFTEVWPHSAVSEMGATSAGVVVAKDTTAHFYATNKTTDVEHLDKLRSAGNSFGFQVEYTTDYRNLTCVTLTEARTGERSVVRIGPEAVECGIAAQILKDELATNLQRKSALVAIDALLRQNKVLDDTGTNPSLLNGEAIAFMLLAVAKSYSADDEPDAGRLLVDFFLTFGFAAHFDCATNSVNYKGMEPATPKVHKDAQLSVLDPANMERNLTPKLEKFSHIQAVFHYCYTAIAQFTQVNVMQRRAQSALSTVIGGEAFWSRVLQMYHQQISPFVEVVRERQHILSQLL